MRHGQAGETTQRGLAQGRVRVRVRVGVGVRVRVGLRRRLRLRVMQRCATESAP